VKDVENKNQSVISDIVFEKSFYSHSRMKQHSKLDVRFARPRMMQLATYFEFLVDKATQRQTPITQPSATPLPGVHRECNLL
jgi:hypothetical protein